MDSRSAGRIEFRSRATMHPIAYPVPIVTVAAVQSPFLASFSMAPQSRKAVLVSQSFLMIVPTPKESEIAKMKRERRVSGSDVITLIPDTAIFAKRNVDMPPNTERGMIVKKAPNLPNTPNRNIQTPQAIPAQRDATFVSDIMPMFWESVVLGRTIERAEINEFTESPSKPP
mmetsp:Transcript_742/g.1203  ORF Transcript_742/g.1203 Transcript_742/m.1203 type:complete len:172 (-) Transcript_742:1855-2370(-)